MAISFVVLTIREGLLMNRPPPRNMINYPLIAVIDSWREGLLNNYTEVSF